MIYVSDAWKNAHKQMILPESFVEITMGVMDETVSGTVSGTNEASFSNSNVVVNNSEYDGRPIYASLEHNLWSLDGSRAVLMDTDYYNTSAYVTDDDTSGGLTISLPAVNSNSIPGFVIVWSAEYETYATEFTVVVKKGSTVVGTATVKDNTSYISGVELPVSNYDSVAITVQKWSHPNHRNRIDSVMFGQRIVFTKNDIVSYSHEQSGSPLGTELSKNSIEFEVDNSDGRWNPLNPFGMAKYLYERQRVTVRYGLQTNVGVEWMQGGVFYLSEWKAPSNGITATFVARDVIEFMLNATYSRPYLEGVTTSSVSAYSTKDGVITTLGEPGTGTLTASLPQGTAVKIYEKCVQFHQSYADDPESAGWMLYRIEEGWVRSDNISVTSDTSLQTEFFNVIHSCIPSDVTVFHAHDAQNVPVPITVEETTVAEFVQKCGASCGITLWQRADGTVRFYAPYTTLSDYVIPADTSYTHPEVELTKPLKQVNVVYHYDYHPDTKTQTFDVGEAGDVITVDAPYMWKESTRIQSLANKYINWWKHREVVSGEFRADPRLELFDVVQVETKYGTLSPVMITYIKYTYSGSFRATYEGKVIEEA